MCGKLRAMQMIFGQLQCKRILSNRKENPKDNSFIVL